MQTYDLKTWHKLFDVNVHGVFYGVQAVSKYMLEKGKGSIIITSSISGTIVNRPQLQCAVSLSFFNVYIIKLILLPQYNTTKSAVSMLTKCLAVEWAKRGVRVNAICPGYMKTDLLDNTNKENPDWEKTWLESTPMGRIGEASELKGAVVFLASDASSYVTGTELFVDGGYTAI